MQNDAVIWQVINHGHCTYKVKTKTQNFCRNEYNVTGLCNRSSCPLANSRYATIREEEGRLYLYIKTIERAHTPNRMWQKIRLKRNYAQALEQVDTHLAYWPKFLVHKNKQRLTKITQYLIRMRRLQLRPRTKLVTMPARTEKRDARREVKALKAAKVETAIEAELLARLKQGTYGDIYNFDQKVYERVLQAAEDEAVKEAEAAGEEFVEDDEEEDEDDEDEEIEYLNEADVNLEEEEEDMEDYEPGPRGMDGQEEDDSPSSSGRDEDDESGLDDDNDDEGASAGGDGYPANGRGSGAGARAKRGAAAAAAGKGAGRDVKRRRRPANVEYEVEQEREDLPARHAQRQLSDW